MRSYITFFFFFLFSFRLIAQDFDPKKIEEKYFAPLLIIMEDESKEDSISILINAAADVYIKENRYLDFFSIALPYIEDVYYSGYLDVADQLLEDYILITQERFPSEKNLLANLYNRRADAFTTWGGNHKADSLIKKAIENRALANEARPILAAVDFDLAGSISLELGHFNESEKYYSQAFDILKKELGYDNERMAVALYNLGDLYQVIGLYDKALDCNRKTLDIYHKLFGANHANNIEVLLNISGILLNKGAHSKSIEFSKKGLELLKINDIENENQGIANFNLGLNHAKLGNLSLAESFFQKALTVFQQLDDVVDLEAKTLQALANMRAEQKNLQDAINIRQKALQLFTQYYGHDHPVIPKSLQNLSVDFLDLGQLDSSLIYVQKSIVILETFEGQEWDLAKTYNSLADVHLAKTEWSLAQQATQQALSLQEKITQRHANLAYSYNTLAKLQLLQGQPQKALQFAHQAVQANHTSFADEADYTQSPVEGYFKYDYYFESILQKAAAFQALGQGKEALDQYKIADQVLEKAKYQINSRKDKVNLAKLVYRLSAAAIQHTVDFADQKNDQSLLQEAHYFSEKSKANVLLQSITANRAKNFGAIPDSLIAKEEALQTDINYYNLALAEQPDSVQIAAFRAALFNAQKAHAALIQQFETDYPSYYELKYQNLIPEITALQAGLKAEQALISYFTLDSLLYAFYLDQDRYQVYQSPIASSFTNDLKSFRDGIALQLNEQYFDQAQRLYETLFPFTIPNDIEELVIIPDGALTQIPFEALLTNPVEETTNFSDLPYLLKKFRLSYAPSLALFHQLNLASESNSSAEGLLAYAPVFSEPEEMSSMAQDFFSKLEESDQRAYTKDGKYITPLPGTAKELEAISTVFKEQNLPVITYTYKTAKEEQIKNVETQDYKYLHVATHGFVNESNPDLSGLLFYPDSTSTEDGILASGEVYSLKLKADLVVLSACETGMGKITYGEGLLGLSQAFLYAGAKDLLVSMWKVDDQATAQLMTEFYKKHLQSRLFNDALQESKLELIKTESYAHPYYWSAFLLIGK